MIRISKVMIMKELQNSARIEASQFSVLFLIAVYNTLCLLLLVLKIYILLYTFAVGHFW